MEVLNNVLNIALVLLVMFVAGAFILKWRVSYLKRKLTNSIIMMYPSIIILNREQLNKFKKTLKDSEGLVRADVISFAKSMSDIRERMLDVEEETKTQN